MGQRDDLQTLLESITPVVYFQEPPSVNMQYPCIVYERDYKDTKFANGLPYAHRKRYQVTIMDTNPDSILPDQVAALPLCVFDRHFTANNLHHDVYKLYF